VGRVFAASLPKNPAASPALRTQALAVMAQMVASESCIQQIFTKAQTCVSGLVRSPDPRHSVLKMRQALLSVSVSAEQNRYAANHDSLTGLPNRAMFDFFLSHQMAACARQKSALSVMFIDLDGFKSVNDAYGHAVGDKLLVAVSDRMQKNLRTSDLVARMGGDEFAFVLLNTDVEQVKIFAERLLNMVSEAYCLEGIDAHISASIGMAFYPSPFDQDLDSQGLLNAADKAMYNAKKLGKNPVFVSSASALG
jgi:diguanylate cyclase (GGDEF)-like protein